MEEVLADFGLTMADNQPAATVRGTAMREHADRSAPRLLRSPTPTPPSRRLPHIQMLEIQHRVE